MWKLACFSRGATPCPPHPAHPAHPAYRVKSIVSESGVGEVLGHSSALNINAVHCESGLSRVDVPWLARCFAAHLGWPLKTLCGAAWCEASRCCRWDPPPWYPSCHFAVVGVRDNVVVACNNLRFYQQRVVKTLLRSDQNLSNSGTVTLLLH
jgi:hypothetical protein